MWLVSEPLPPGDLCPRREEVEDVTAGAKATVWGLTEPRESCRAASRHGVDAECSLSRVPSCLRENILKVIFVFSFEEYNRKKFGNAHILRQHCKHD